jgi:hypothetical protein
LAQSQASKASKPAPEKPTASSPTPTPRPAAGMSEMISDSMTNAKVVDLENKSKVLFTYAHISRVEGERRNIENTFFDLQGNQVVVEHASLGDNGVTLYNYRVEQKQTGGEGSIQVHAGTAELKYTIGGKTKTSSTSAGPDLIAGPTLANFLRANWSKLMGGEKIKARFVALERAEAVGFEYFKDGESEVSGQKAVVIKMKPSSFLIAALVNPIKLYFTPDGKKLLQFEGRTLPKIKSGDKWKDLEALTIYE